ncbi:hypothetical protein CKR_1360 [Clostridium kluyveri NBRC 12016]|uniref:Uncharacterized protein n=1 Tax=Clostridium kluyveri (strain NBRC 12016) TaxID=583346 RepID=B9E1N6_CLOK1|nr:hypothetical protein CKR_1360 [Clostridium kluyveri NBRC 12016]
MLKIYKTGLLAKLMLKIDTYYFINLMFLIYKSFTNSPKESYFPRLCPEPLGDPPLCPEPLGDPPLCPAPLWDPPLCPRLLGGDGNSQLVPQAVNTFNIEYSWLWVIVPAATKASS